MAGMDPEGTREAFSWTSLDVLFCRPAGMRRCSILRCV
jgi:hypothetical protein